MVATAEMLMRILQPALVSVPIVAVERAIAAAAAWIEQEGTR